MILSTEQQQAPPDKKRSFNWWPWSPLFVIGAAAIANGAMFIMANDVRPQKVEEQPYVASSRIDGEKIAAEQFSKRGFTLLIKATDPLSITLSIPENADETAPAKIFLYRPDSAAHDQELTWDNPTKPFPITLSKPGMWRIRLTMLDNNGTEMRAESAIDTIAVTTP